MAAPQWLKNIVARGTTALAPVDTIDLHFVRGPIHHDYEKDELGAVHYVVLACSDALKMQVRQIYPSATFSLADEGQGKLENLQLEGTDAVAFFAALKAKATDSPTH